MKEFIKIKLNKYLTESLNGNEYIFYHGTNNESFDLSKVDEGKGLWLTPDINYAKLWGDNLYEVKIVLTKILDTFSDVGKKKKTLYQWVKYLKSKGIDTDDFEHAQKIDKFDSETFMFWDLISKHHNISYVWLTFDIEHSGYDAITVFEYGYSYSQKSNGGTILILNPKEKIKEIKKIKRIDENEITSNQLLKK